MTDETIVAVYDTSEQAARAVQELEAAGVPPSAIKQHAAGGSTPGSTTTAAPVREQGFWSSLFGGEPEQAHDTTVYDRSLEAGSTVLTVKTSEQHLTQVMDILERHNPVDIDERASGYGAGQTAAAGTGSAIPSTGTGTGSAFSSTQPTTGTAGTSAGTLAATGTAGAASSGGETIPLSEENLTIGKRAINRGSTRIRRYVVETPVEEQVTLRDENVSVERRPVSGGSPIGDADFTDKVIEVTETGEEAVVSKTARVKEEVVVHKDATDRTETVRDTVRREDVEITKEPGTERSTNTAANAPTTRDPKI